ncbi:restriction endonuclease [Homoserinimonas sp. A520]
MSEIALSPGFLLDWQAAETAAVSHMRTLRFIDAQATGPGTDGGIDALSTEAAAQVKFYANPIGRPDIQRLRGAAHEYRLALFYSTGGYTKEAVEYATEAGVALFQMDPYGSCEPASELAEVLGEPEHVHERKQQMEELQAVRYRFAASALEADLELYAEFARVVSLAPDEEALFSHVESELALLVREFRTIIEFKKFAEADAAFGEIQKRTSFLSFITGSELGAHYTDLEEAISEGWQCDATPGSDHLLQRAAEGVFALSKFHGDHLKEWVDQQANMPQDLIDAKTLRFAGMLLVTSFDSSLLSSELHTKLNLTLKSGVERGHKTAQQAFDQIRTMYADMRREEPREVTVLRLREQSIAARVLRQLGGSLALSADA